MAFVTIESLVRICVIFELGIRIATLYNRMAMCTGISSFNDPSYSL